MLGMGNRVFTDRCIQDGKAAILGAITSAAIVAAFVFVPALAALYITIFRTIPFVGYVVSAVVLCYVPSLFYRRRPKVEIDENFKVTLIAGSAPDREVLKEAAIRMGCFLFHLFCLWIFWRGV
jgi:ABC-type amino acid transport system permease subunit